MKYLDYLPDFAYDELPVDIQLEIGREDYEQMRRIANALSNQAPPAGLPDSLKLAFREKLQSTPIIRPVANRWRWAAAAGWLLFVGSMFLLLGQRPPETIVYQEVLGPTPDPLIVHQVDTFIETQTLWRNRWDTIFVMAEPLPVEVVVQIDTVYLPATGEHLIQAVSGSQSLKGKEGVLDFLVGTD